MMPFSLSLIHPLSKAEAASHVAHAVRRRFPDDVVACQLADRIDAASFTVGQSAGAKHEKVYTDAVVRRDRERDQAFSALCRVVEGNILCPRDPERRKKALHLYERLVPGNLDFLDGSMHAESAILQERLEYLDSPEGAVLAAGLDLTYFVEALRVAMQSFEMAWNERSAKRRARPAPLREVERPLDQALRALHAYLLSRVGEESTRAVFTELAHAAASGRAAATRRRKAADEPA